MNCKVITKNGGAVGFACGNFPKPKMCFYCERASTKLCDFPVRKLKNGKWKTCDAPLCDFHANPGKTPDVDFCKPHFVKAKAAFERRQNVTDPGQKK